MLLLHTIYDPADLISFLRGEVFAPDQGLDQLFRRAVEYFLDQLVDQINRQGPE